MFKPVAKVWVGEIVQFNPKAITNIIFTMK